MPSALNPGHAARARSVRRERERCVVLRERDIDAVTVELLLRGNTEGLRKLAAGVARILNNEVPCPTCGHEGPHDDNGCRGADLSFSCAGCGPVVRPAARRGGVVSYRVCREVGGQLTDYVLGTKYGPCDRFADANRRAMALAASTGLPVRVVAEGELIVEYVRGPGGRALVSAVGEVR
jgi:hypothetical protein